MVTTTLIFATLVFGIILYIFFSPIYFEIDTTNNLFRIRLGEFVSVRFLPSSKTIILEAKILWWKKQINLLVPEEYKDKGRITKSKIEDKKKAFFKISLRRSLNVLRSFKINQCKISLDTGNIIMNTFLFPIFYLIQVKANKNIQINFINNNEIILEIENSLARMSWAYISS